MCGACNLQRVQCCEVCGVVAHEGACARRAAQDCRPVAEAAPALAHLWQPAGTIFYDSEVPPNMARSDWLSLACMTAHRRVLHAWRMVFLWEARDTLACVEYASHGR